jgi:hypothetical protein
MVAAGVVETEERPVRDQELIDPLVDGAAGEASRCWGSSGARDGPDGPNTPAFGLLGSY